MSAEGRENIYMEIGFFGFGDIKWYLRSFDRDERFWDLGVIGL